MIKYIKYIGVTLLLLFILSITTLYILRWNTPSITTIKNKWGYNTFYIDKFRTGNYQTRASMAADLLQRKSEFIGLNIIDIKKQLGQPNGYFINETNPAYIIESKENTWQLIFQIYNNNVVNIFVHKSCCYNQWQAVLMNSAFQVLYYALIPILFLLS